MIDALLLILGICLVLWGADKLTDGATGLAHRFGVSDLVIGLTVVAFGTSLPEFVTSFTAIIKGNEGISAGNVIGSNIFNTLLIVGASALTFPIWVSKSSLTKDIPFAILASFVLFLICGDKLLGTGMTDVISLADGLILLCFFTIFMFYTFSMAKTKEPESGEQTSVAPPMSYAKIAAYIVLGLACLILGGNLFVSGASSVALAWGMSEHLVGITIVACGTSLPELATSIVAARKGNSAIAIGNVIGSNIFNIFFVLGACALVAPISVEAVSSFDMVMLLLSMALLWFFACTSRRIVRWEGAALVVCYLLYMGYYVLQY